VLKLMDERAGVTAIQNCPVASLLRDYGRENSPGNLLVYGFQVKPTETTSQQRRMIRLINHMKPGHGHGGATYGG